MGESMRERILNQGLETEPEEYSLRTAETPYRNELGENRYHSFLVLVNNTTGQIVDELHFKEGCDTTPRGENLLSVENYVSSRRTLEDLATVTYLTGSKADVRAEWQKALHLGEKIRKKNLPFENGACRVLTCAIIEALGYEFEIPPQLDISFTPNSRTNNMVKSLLVDSVVDTDGDYVCAPPSRDDIGTPPGTSRAEFMHRHVG